MISNQQKALTVFRLGDWRYIRSATATTAIDFRSEGPGFYSSSEMFFAVQLFKIWFIGGILVVQLLSIQLQVFTVFGLVGRRSKLNNYYLQSTANAEDPVSLPGGVFDNLLYPEEVSTVQV